MHARYYLLILLGCLISITHASTESTLAAVDKSIRQRNYQQAVMLLKPLVQQNNAVAQFRLAGLYRAGKGVEKNQQRALELYEAAANNGHSEAGKTLAAMQKKRNRKTSASSSNAENLIDAVLRHDTSYVKRAASSRADLNTVDQHNRSLLHIATRLGFIDIVRLLLSQNVEIDTPDTLGNTALMSAIQNDNRNLVDLLLKHQADPTLRNRKQVSALDLASKLNAKNSLSVLEKAGFKTAKPVTPAISRTNFDSAIRQSASLYPGWPMLNIACQLNEGEIAKQLLQQGAKVDAVDKAGFSALHRAAAKGHLTIVKTLLANGANINAVNKNHESALYLSAAEGRYNTVKHLLKNGAKTQPTDPDKHSALSIAIINQHEKTAGLLINKPLGAKQRHRALMLATQQKMESLALQLVDKDKLLDQPDRKKRSLLWYSAELGLNQLVIKLLAARPEIDINRTDNDGFNALARAASRGHLKIARQLIDQGAELNSKTRQGNSLLMLAVLSGQGEMVDFLSRSDIDLNWRNKSGATALMLAAASGNHRITKQLIEAGADIGIRNQDNFNAYQIALNAEHKQVAELIKSHSGALFKLFN